MKLLVITQKVDADDPVLGFFVTWIQALTKQFDELTVICLERGRGAAGGLAGSTLPSNVRIFSLGKEQGQSRFQYVINFYRYIWRERSRYDTVFVHMNQEYVLLAGPLWRLWGKRIVLWRNHKQGSWLTNLAVLFANRVLYTSPSSYTARFKKSRQMPVGIDTAMFTPDVLVQPQPHSILFLGRIAPVKKVEAFIEALGLLAQRNQPFIAVIYGDALPKDRAYFQELRHRAAALNLTQSIGGSARLSFHPGVPNAQTPALYASQDIFVNLTPVGSFDKTIVEAAASGSLVLTANSDLAGEMPPICITSPGTVDIVADGLEKLLALSLAERTTLSASLRAFAQKHSLDSLVAKLVAETAVLS